MTVLVQHGRSGGRTLFGGSGLVNGEEDEPKS